MVGDRIEVGTEVANRYRVTRKLGEGGMGEVYAAHDGVLDTSIALKTLRAELAGSTIALERFRREIALARRVTDPHVCRVFDVGEHAGSVFLTMELLDGVPLAGPLPVADLDRIAPQLVRALAALHAAGIVHRDLKTANILVTADRAVITDFGIARSVDQDAALTVEGGLLGTPAYMAPEQVEGRPATSASDIYALGVVLFELATGTRPFAEDTVLATATARLTREPPRPSSLRPDLPARWDAIILRCLARDPAARPAATEVLAPPSSRRTVLALAGLGIAGAALGAWRLFAPDTATPFTGTVAMLAVEGGQDNPIAAALTIDLHDRLATTGAMLLSIAGGGMWENRRGPAVTLLRQRDPTAAAFAIEGVTAVVRTKLVGSEPVDLEVTIEREDRATRTIRMRRPRGEATILVDELAGAIASALGLRAPRPAGDTRRYADDLYERYGVALVEHFHREGVYPLDALVAREPRFIRAAARSACGIISDGDQFEDHRVLEYIDRARAHVDRVLAVEPDHAHACATRGRAHMLRYEWREADEWTKRGFELSPAFLRARFQRGMFTVLTGRFDEHLAISSVTKRLNQALGAVAWSYFYTRRYPQYVKLASAQWRALNPTVWPPRDAQLSVGLAEMSRFDEATAIADILWAEHRREDDPYELGMAVTTYMLAGQRDKAIKLREYLGSKTDAWAVATMEDAIGNVEAALPHFEKCVAVHNVHAMFIKIDRVSSQTRAHPRFQALVRRVGLA